MGERFLYATNLVPKDSQSMVTPYKHDYLKMQGNPMSGIFRAPSLKWGGAKAISDSNFAVQRNEQIRNIQKRGRDYISLPNLPHHSGASSDSYAQVRTQELVIQAVSKVESGHGAQQNKKIKPKKKVFGPMPKLWK